jgi:hypothetical protein
MLHKETVSPGLLQTLEELMKIDSLKAFRLVGGTALALQMGHRKSVDIDLFVNEYPLNKSVVEEIKLQYPQAETRFSKFHITTYLPFYGNDELKVDMMSTDVFIRPVVIKENIRLAHTEEIAAMKLEAITSRKEKKDYWDIFILMQKYGLTQLFEFYEERYPWNDLREVIENLGLFEHCDNQPNPIILDSQSWHDVKSTLSYELEIFINKEIK